MLKKSLSNYLPHPADARKFAKKNRMYVIDILEEEDRSAIDAPEKRKIWQRRSRRGAYYIHTSMQGLAFNR